MRKWEVAPKTFAETQLDAKTMNAAKAAARMKSKTGINSATDQSGQKSVNDARAGGEGMSRGSIPQFHNSPSGGGLSERRWQSPSGQGSQGYRHGASMSPGEDESKNPFTARSGRGSGAGERGSTQQIIKLQD